MQCTQRANISYNDANEVVDEHFDSVRSRYQDNLEASMRWSEFIFVSVQLIFYKCHEANFRRDGSYIDSQDWINPKNEYDKCFQYAVTVALNYEEMWIQKEVEVKSRNCFKY